MRVFVVAMVSALGLALYALAALVWDRRQRLPHLLAPGHRRWWVPRWFVDRRDWFYLPHLIVLAAVLIATALLCGSCLGLVTGFSHGVAGW